MNEFQQDVAPVTQAELGDWLATNSSSGRKTVCPTGGRTSLHIGAEVQAEVGLSLEHLNRLVDYPARDMTITVEAGMRISDLQTTLAVERQRLPVDVAQLHRATVGGMLATNTSGPRRLGYGTLRDWLIGISAIDANGRHFKAGGRVVKNVAGYDLCKLLIGSHGTLAVITQATFKVAPKPESQAYLWCEFADFPTIEQVLLRLLTSGTRPVVLDVLNPVAAEEIGHAAHQVLPCQRPVLVIGFEGTTTEVNWQTSKVQLEIGELHPLQIVAMEGNVADHIREELTEFQIDSDEPVNFVATVRPSRAVEFLDRATRLGVAAQLHAGCGTIIGQLNDEIHALDAAQAILHPLRSFAREVGGGLQVEVAPQEWKASLPSLDIPPANRQLMQRLKDQFDPLGLLNPGRLFSAGIQGSAGT